MFCTPLADSYKTGCQPLDRMVYFIVKRYIFMVMVRGTIMKGYLNIESSIVGNRIARLGIRSRDALNEEELPCRNQ